MDLHDVTVVILSRGREIELVKTLEYWSNFDISVLVLHNTEKPLQRIADMPNVRYVVAKLPYGERCGMVSEYLATEYAILSSDDEVYLPSALAEMKALLDNDRDLKSIGALTLAIGSYGPMTTGTFSYSKMLGYSNRAKTPLNRLNAHFSENGGYRNGAIYRLMRKELMNSMMNLFAQISECSTPYIYEVTGEIFINASGESQYVDTIYWLRNWINSPVGHQNWDRKLYFKDWISRELYKSQYLKWKIILQEATKISSGDFHFALSKIVQLRKQSEEYEEMKNIRRRWALPANIKWLIRKILNPKTLPTSIFTLMNDLEAIGIKVDQEGVIKGLNTLS